MKKQLCFMISAICFNIYADNATLFNNAYQTGKQNQFNLNLNSNSTFTTYGQANSFESSLANSANTGNANAKTMYNNTYSDNADPNYLYKSGINEIQRCQSSNDPKCTTLNKYGDRDTQTQLQAYQTGVSDKYYISVRADPASSACSYVSKKVPISQIQSSCISSSRTQTTCTSGISIGVNYYDCDPNNGSCNSYQNDSNCSLVKPFIKGRCNYMCDSSHHKTSNAYCPYWDDVQGGGSGGNFVWGTCQIGATYYCSGVNQTVTCGTNAGTPSPNWNVNFSNCTQDQLATYACKASQYSDGCMGFKK